MQAAMFEQTAHQSGAALPGTTSDRLPLVTSIFIFSLVTPLVFTLGPIAFNFPRLILLITFIPCLYLLVSGKRGRIHPTDILFAGFVFWFGASLLYHHGFAATERIGQNLVNSFGAYLLARTTITNAAQFRKMVSLLCIAAALVLPFALVEAFTGRVILNEFLDKMPMWTSFRHVDGPARLGLDRAQGTFEHPILYGVFSSSLIVLASLVRGSKVWILPAAFGGFLSLSTAALLQMVVHFFFLSWNFILRNLKSRWKLLLILTVSAYLLVDLVSSRSPVRVFISYATFNMGTGYHRIHTWNYGLQNVIDNPIFGIGLNQWERPGWLHSASVDNFWLVAAMWTGFPGIAALLGGVFLSIFKAVRRNIPNEMVEARYRIAWVLTIVAICISLSTVHVWNATYSFFFFLVGSGIWFARVEPTTGNDLTTSDPASVPGRQEIVYTRFAKRGYSEQPPGASNTNKRQSAPATSRAREPSLTSRFPHGTETSRDSGPR